MPIIITLAHQKGGVGKTTLAMNLKTYFSMGGYKTVAVDIDPQGSLYKLVHAFSDQEGREVEHCIGRNKFSNFDELLKMIEPYDIAVIDTPPYLSQEIASVVALSNLVVIPCKASPLDFLAIHDTLNLIRSVKVTNPDLLSVVALTMTITGTDFTQYIRGELEKSADEFPVLKTEIGNRVAYMRSLLYGNSVMSDENRKAHEEIENFGQELISLLKQHHGWKKTQN